MDSHVPQSQGAAAARTKEWTAMFRRANTRAGPRRMDSHAPQGQRVDSHAQLFAQCRAIQALNTSLSIGLVM